MVQLINSSEAGFRLHIYNSGSVNTGEKVFTQYLGYNDNINGYISFHRGSSGTDGYLSFGDNGGERVRFANGGNVGIGTTNPGNLLTVNGSMRLVTSTLQGLFAYDAASGGAYIYSITRYTDYNANDLNINARAGFGIKVNTTSGLVTAGHEFYITSAGNVGIGTTSPSQKLEVAGNIFANAGNGEGFLLNGGSAIYRQNGSDLAFNVNSAERMRITSAGNMGIGITNPSYALDVSGSIRSNQQILAGSSITTSSESTLILGPAPAGGSGEGGQIALQPGSGYTSGSFLDNYQNKLRILRGTAGATDAEVAAFNLHTKQLTLPAYNSTTAFTGTVAGILAFDSSGNILTTTASAGGGGGSGTVNSGTAGYLAYYPSTGTTVDDTSGVYWDAGNSRLAVGNSSPSYKVDVTGDIRATGAIYANANGAMYFQGGDDVALYDINVANTLGVYGQQDSTLGSIKLGSGGGVISGYNGNIGIGTTAPGQKLHVAGTVITTSTLNSVHGSFSIDHPGIQTWKIGVTDGNTSTFHIGNDTGGSFSTKLLNLTNAGNVGIGTTNPVSYSGYTSLTIGDESGTKIGLLKLRSNYNSGNGAEIYQNGSGIIYINTNSSTTAMTITAAGNVGIGTTNPSSKLHIDGTTAYNNGLTVSGNAPDGVGLRLNNTNGNDWYLISTGDNNGGGAGNLGFYNHSVGDYRVYFKANGNVGIGVTNPNTTLEVNKTISFSSIDTYAQLVVKTTSGANGKLLNIGVDESAGLSFIQSLDRGTDSMPLILQRYSGNVGIGITNPSYKLDVAGTFGTSGDATFNGTYTNINSSYITVGNDATDVVGIAGSTMYFPGNGNVGIGTTNPAYKLSVIGKIALNSGAGNDIFIGDNAGLSDDATNNANLAIGINASQNNVSGSQNVAIGNNSLQFNVASNNTAVGSNASRYNTLGDNNTSFGSYALWSTIDGRNNTGIGAAALLFNTSGSSNTAVGSSALRNNTSGSGNIGIGLSALNPNTLGNDNIAVGRNAGRYYGSTGTNALTNTSASIFIGDTTRANNLNETNQIVIGVAALGLGSNTVVLGNDNITTTALKGNVGIGTTNPTQNLHVAGNLRVTGAIYDSNNAAGSSGQVLSSTGTGTDWVSLSEITGVDGTGTANYVTKWQDSNTVTNSVMYDDGTNIGIGTTSPAAKLHIDSTSGQFRISGNSNNFNIYSWGGGVNVWGSENIYFGRDASTNNNFYFQTGNAASTAMYIETGNSRVGINTTAPQKPLEVISNANDFVTVGATSLSVGQWTGIHFGYRENNTLYRKSAIVFERTDLTASDAQGKIHILNGPQASNGSATLSDAKITIAENGNVGIGTTSPSAKLHIKGNATDNVGLALFQNDYASGDIYFPAASFINTRGNHSYGIVSEFRINTSGDSDRPSILFYGAQASHSWQVGQVTSGWGTNDAFGIGYRASNDPTTFNSWPSNYFTILTGGNVGIGTNNPGYKLEVNGWVGASRYYPYSSNSTYIDGDGSGLRITGTGYLYVPASGGSYFEGSVRMRGSISNDNGAYLQINGGTSGHTYFDGNVGIGITNPSAKLQVNAGSGYPLILDSTQQYLLGLYSSGTAEWWLAVNGGDLKFHENGVGDQITFKAGGNVGIGITNPSTKLAVNGTAIANHHSVYANNYNGYGFWGETGGGAYSMWMADSATAGGQLTGDTSGNDYNMYFKMQYANRGFIFITGDNTSHFQITNEGAFVKGNIKLTSTAGQTSTPSYIWLGNDFSNGTTRDKLKVYLYNSGTEQYGFGVGSSGDIQYHSNTIHDFYINNSFSTRINSTGLAVGTTSAPGNRLIVAQDTGYTNENLYTIAAAASTNTAYKLILGYDYSQDIGVISAVQTGVAWKNLSISPNGGNVGIGTIGPSQKLHVAGNLRVTGAIYDSNNSAGSSGEILTSTGTGTDWVSLSSISGVDGTGTANYVPKWTDADTIGNSAIYDNSGNIGIGTTNPGAKLEVVGTFRATTKSFLIDHPTKEGKKLQYGVLEGPEHSVYVRGKLTGTRRIELPDYWHALVDEDSITVNLTAIGRGQQLWVEEITDTYIMVGSDSGIVNCFYTVFAERKDVDKLITEFDKE